jgi:predicted phosphodiesterase
MRIAVLSDIHGNLPALEAVIADLRSRSPDLVVNLGDCASGFLWPKETCELLMSLGWTTIRGNCDRDVATVPRDSMHESDAFAFDRLDSHQRAWLGALAAPQSIAGHVFACHSTPADDDEYLVDDIASGVLIAASPANVSTRLGNVAEKLTLCGHSHVPRLIRSADERTVLNPGSVGLPAYESEWNGSRYFAESGSPHARYAIVTQRGERFDFEMIAISYNYAEAARKAEIEGRMDYVKALRTGTTR